MGNRMNDRELGEFLKRNQPLPPAAEAGEMEAIYARIEATERRKKSFALFLAPALAAATLAVFLVGGQLISPGNTGVPAVTMLAGFDEVTEEFQEELPALEVGEGYLELAGLVD